MLLPSVGGCWVVGCEGLQGWGSEGTMWRVWHPAMVQQRECIVLWPRFLDLELQVRGVGGGSQRMDATTCLHSPHSLVRPTVKLHFMTISFAWNYKCVIGENQSRPGVSSLMCLCSWLRLVCVEQVLETQFSLTIKHQRELTLSISLIIILCSHRSI